VVTRLSIDVLLARLIHVYEDVEAMAETEAARATVTDRFPLEDDCCCLEFEDCSDSCTRWVFICALRLLTLLKTLANIKKS